MPAKNREKRLKPLQFGEVTLGHVWWATKTRLVDNKTRLVDNQNTFGGQPNTFGGQPKHVWWATKHVWWATKHVWWATKHVWWATKRRCPPYELLPIKIGNSGYFYRQFETSPIWRGGYLQNENPEVVVKTMLKPQIGNKCNG